MRTKRRAFAQAKSLISLDVRFLLDEYRAVFRVNVTSPLQLIKDGKPVRYEGVIGPVSFDQYGDITGPFRLWRIQNGEITTVGQMGVDEVNAIMAKIPSR
jgi:hypothetical protein